MAFEYQPVLTDGDLVLRPLTQDDYKGLEAAAKDPLIWEQHPAKDRVTPDGFAKYFAFLLSTEQCLVFDLNEQIIGCSRFYDVPNEPDDIGVGYTFLTRAYWGGGMNGRIKALMLEHAFQSYPRVLFHIDPNNLRSQRGTAKLGARPLYEADIDLGQGPEPFKVYEVRATDWIKRKGIAE